MAAENLNSRRGMTVEEIANGSKEMLTATDVCGIMAMHPSRICYYARTNQLPFECMMSGNRVKIPRRAFLRFIGYQGADN